LKVGVEDAVNAVTLLNKVVLLKVFVVLLFDIGTIHSLSIVIVFVTIKSKLTIAGDLL
jgi:hypothetical protein